MVADRLYYGPNLVQPMVRLVPSTGVTKNQLRKKVNYLAKKIIAIKYNDKSIYLVKIN